LLFRAEGEKSFGRKVVRLKDFSSHQGVIRNDKRDFLRLPLSTLIMKFVLFVAENPKFEARNSKQIQKRKFKMTKTITPVPIPFVLRIQTLDHLVLFRISIFRFRGLVPALPG